MTDEVRLEGGSMTHVVRVGATVRRSPGRQSAAVQALLRHLESEGVDGAPRALGFDDHGRETVTFIDGQLGFVWDDDVLPSLGALIRRLHDAAASFDELPHAPSWIGPIRAPFETICHNDIVPWNTVYRDRMPIALIDWDAAAPDPRAWDLAYAAAFIPLTDPDDAFNSAKAGWSGVPTNVTHRAARLRRLLDGYGMVLDQSFLERVVERLLVMRRHIQALADAGSHHEVDLVTGGCRTSAERQIAWIRTNTGSSYFLGKYMLSRKCILPHSDALHALSLGSFLVCLFARLCSFVRESLSENELSLTFILIIAGVRVDLGLGLQQT